MTERIIVKGGYVVTCDPVIGDIAGGDVLVVDGRIEDVGVDLSDEGCRVIDGSDGIVLPGFVDAHSHLWEQSLRNIGVDWSLPDYHRVVRGVFGAHYRPEDIYAGNLLGAVEAINSGVTTVLDCSHNMNSPEHADAAVEALRTSGLRAVLAYGSANRHWRPEGAREPLSDDARRLRSEQFNDDGLLTMALCSRGAFAGADIVAADIRMARDLDIPITFPAGLPRPGREVPSIVMLHERGLTGPDVLYYHCSDLEPAELDIVVATDAKVAFTPENEMRMGYALPSVGQFIARGVYPGVAVDTPVMSSDYFTALRATLMAEGARHHLEARQRGELVESLRVTVRDVVELATVHGARTCWLGEKTGSLTPGKRADVIVIDTRQLSLTPIYNPLGAVVYNGTPNAVRSVMVDGRVMKLDGKFVGLDVDKVVERADASRRYLFEQAGLGLFDPVR